jgi:hypothetical protein
MDTDLIAGFINTSGKWGQLYPEFRFGSDQSAISFVSYLLRQ